MRIFGSNRGYGCPWHKGLIPDMFWNSQVLGYVVIPFGLLTIAQSCDEWGKGWQKPRAQPLIIRDKRSCTGHWGFNPATEHHRFRSTGRTGRAVIAKLLADGHNVTAFTRDASKLAAAPRFIIVQGDAMQPADVARAVPGHDAAVVTLGNSQNPFALLLGARRTTPPNICEVGTRNIIAAIDPTSPARLIVVAAFGIGDTRDKLPFVAKLFYHSVLREQMADKKRQEAALKSSYLDYVLVQPVALTDKPAAGTWLASASGATRKQYVSRADVAACIAD